MGLMIKLGYDVNMVNIGNYLYLVNHNLNKWVKISSSGEQFIKKVIDKSFDIANESTEIINFVDFLTEEGYLVYDDNKHCEQRFFEFHVYPSNEAINLNKIKQNIFEISAGNDMCVICHCFLNNISRALDFLNDVDSKYSCILLEFSKEDLLMSEDRIREILAPVYNTSTRVVLKCDERIDICNSQVKRFMENIILLLYTNLNTDVSLHMCVNSNNYRCVTDYILFACEFFVDFTWEFEYCKSMLNNMNIISMEGEYEFVKKMLSAFNKTYADEYPWGHYLLNCNHTYKNCNYPINKVYFDLNGNMYPCEFYIGIPGCEIEWDADKHILMSIFKCCHNVQCTCDFNDFCKYKSVKTEAICKNQKFLFDYRLVKFNESQSIADALETLGGHYEENK